MVDRTSPRIYYPKKKKQEMIRTLLIIHSFEEKARDLSIINHNIADKKCVLFFLYMSTFKMPKFIHLIIFPNQASRVKAIRQEKRKSLIFKYTIKIIFFFLE